MSNTTLVTEQLQQRLSVAPLRQLREVLETLVAIAGAMGRVKSTGQNGALCDRANENLAIGRVARIFQLDEFQCTGRALTTVIADPAHIGVVCDYCRINATPRPRMAAQNHTEIITKGSGTALARRNAT